MKVKLISVLLILITGISVSFAVTLEIDSLIITQGTYTNSSNDSSLTINISYPVLSGNIDPQILDELNTYLKNTFMQSLNWYEELMQDSTITEITNDENPYTFETGYRIALNSDGILSLVLDHYQYTGGAHGNYFSTGFTFRLSDGKLLTLNQIINPLNFDVLEYECEQEILNLFNAGSLEEAGLFEPEINLSKDQDFYLLPETLVLQFDPYEIAPYSTGDIEVKIPFEHLTEALLIFK